MALRIGFDLDGVLADMDGELVRQAEGLFGEAMTRRLQERVGQPADTAPPAKGDEDDRSPSEAPLEAAPALQRLNMTDRQQRRLWRHVESVENFWEGLHEIEAGAIMRLGLLATERRWEIIFLTKRPQSAGSTAQLQTQRWLQSKGFTLPSVYVVQGSRGLIATALNLDFVIDDRPENCLDVVVDSKAKAILVWREDEKQIPEVARRLGIGIVKSVNEGLDILAAVDEPGSDRTGLMDRVRRLLGLKRQSVSA